MVFRLSACVMFLCLAAVPAAGAPRFVSPASAPLALEHLPLDVVGVDIVPHTYSRELRYFRSPKEEIGALIRIYVRHRDPAGQPLALGITFNGKPATHWLKKDAWSWYDLPENRPGYHLAPGAMDVYTINAMSEDWAEGDTLQCAARNTATGTEEVFEITLAAIDVKLRQITFPGEARAERCVVHVENGTESPIRVEALRFHGPSDTGITLLTEVTALTAFPADGAIPPLARGGVTAEFPPLPLARGVVEVVVRPAAGGAPWSLWASLMFKPDRFDIGAGWLHIPTPQGVNPLTQEPFLKLLRRLHVDTAHIEEVPGYTDTPLAGKYPLRMMSELKDVAKFNADEWLPRIHGVDCLGEPQMGTSPVACLDVLRHYAQARYPTTLTLSEDKGFREYAGLSDFPHFDAYRVCAPAADSWFLYQRWEDGPVIWGAPLEGIGEMVRTLRVISRPLPVALWSQNVHEGWQDQFSRPRKSPTADEILVQAYQGLANGVTSFYWYSLQSDSMLTYRDTLATTARIGREMRLLQDFYLRADAYHHERVNDGERPSWDLNVLATPDAAVLFAIDLAYRPDREKRVFTWPGPRALEARFAVPAYLGTAVNVFRVDADATHDVDWSQSVGAITLRDTVDRVGIYLASKEPALRERLNTRLSELKQAEAATGFDPIHNEADFEALRDALRGEQANAGTVPQATQP